MPKPNSFLASVLDSPLLGPLRASMERSPSHREVFHGAALRASLKAAMRSGATVVLDSPECFLIWHCMRHGMTLAIRGVTRLEPPDSDPRTPVEIHPCDVGHLIHQGSIRKVGRTTNRWRVSP